MAVAFLCVVLTVVVLVAAVMKVWSEGAAARAAQEAARARAMPYTRNHALLSETERMFFNVLELAVDERYRIMAKVRLADALKVHVTLSNDERQRALNKINSKHIDFLLCHADDLSIAARDRTERRQPWPAGAPPG